MDNIEISLDNNIAFGQEPGVIVGDNSSIISAESVISGPPGPQGEPGFSPIANVTQTDNGAIISITDQQGTTSATVTNGANGFSPSANVVQTASGATITVTDAHGQTTANISNGTQGQPGENATIAVGNVTTLDPSDSATVENVGTTTNAILDFGIPRGEQGIQGVPGADGVSPIAYVEQITGGARVVIDDSQTTTTADIMNGTDGTDGYSPTASVTQGTGSATITITDQQGTTTATVYDGQNGTNGQDGFSPSASVTQTASGATISITDSQGTTTANITNGVDGTDGTDGTDGFSPSATVTQNTGSATISITDLQGTTTATIYDGQPGQPGTDGVTPSITATASVNSSVGTPSVSVTKSGTDENPQFAFAFSNLKGDTGSQGSQGPAGQGVVDYSTNEVDTGVKWVDGSTLYRKVINFGALPNASQKSMAHGVSGINLHKMTGIARNPGTGITFILPTLSTSFGACITMYADNTNVYIDTQSTNRSAYTECYVILEYTKVS